MALQSSGQIKLSEIRNEFGLGSGQIAMSSLYGKGNAAASGQIQMAANFYGTAGSLVAGSITRGGLEDKSGRWIVGRHDNTPNSSANIGSISYSTSETFGNRFFYDAGVENTLKIVPNNATCYTKVDKINIGGRTYTRRRGLGSQFSSVGEMPFASNYQNNYVRSVGSTAQALSSSPFTSSSAMSFTAEEDRSFFCNTNFTSGSPATQSSTNSKTNTSQRRDYRGFQISTNSNLQADSQTFGTQSSITITNPDYSAATTGIAGFFVKRIRDYNGTTFSGTPTIRYLFYCILTTTAGIPAPHPSNAGGGTFSTNSDYWQKLNGLKRFEVTVGSTTQYYVFGAHRASLLGSSVGNFGFDGNNSGIWAMENTSAQVDNIGASAWNHIGSGNTVNIKLY